MAWARESVVSEVPIPRGSVITKEMVWVKRPSPGPGVVAAKDLGKVIGKVAQGRYSQGQPDSLGAVERMKPRKIAVVSEARATYGYIKKVMHLIERSEQLELQLIVTGMHLLKEYGSSIDEILRDGFKPAARVDMYVGGDTPTAWSKSLGVEIQGLAQVFDMLKPDLLLVAGDRAEILAATVTAAYMNIPLLISNPATCPAISTAPPATPSRSWRTSICRLVKTPLNGCEKWARSPGVFLTSARLNSTMSCTARNWRVRSCPGCLGWISISRFC